MYIKSYLLVATLSLLSFTTQAAEKIANTSNKLPKFLYLDWLDTRISPQQDFYSYANGGWRTRNPIPPDYAIWGSFTVLAEKVQNQVHALLQEAMNNKKAKKGSITQKVGDFYYSGMDLGTINTLGAKPLAPIFHRIESIKNQEELQALLPELQLLGVDALFGISSMQDFMNSKHMIGIAGQGGISLPDRDYYLKDDPKFKHIRELYLQHIAKMLELLGDDKTLAKKEAKIVMSIETGLAKASMSQTAQRDPKAIYNVKTLAELKDFMPNFSWPNYLKAMGLPKLKKINIANLEFFKYMDSQLKTRSLSDWKIYLRWQLIDAFASYLSEPFVMENFHMSQALAGTKKLLPRWKRVVATENSVLGFAIGKIYVEKYFSASAKQEVLDILHSIKQTLKDDLKTLDWMTKATREAALKKLSMIEDRVGYPDKWRDYSLLTIDRGPYVLNVMRGSTFAIKRELHKIGKPVDRSEWGMAPQTINAYYDFSMNNINLPAGILQAPFFDPAAPAAVNYGGIGFVVGHEITHGFDDQGSQFDGYGNLKNWWTPSDLKKFQKRTQCIVDQFSKYRVEDNLSVQGKLVVGEATADLGGLTLAYRAFQNSKAYKEAKTIHGFSPDQQFFISSAHVWANNIRPLLVRNLITTDPHPPSRYRVNGTLANMPQFHAAFSVPAKSPMISEKRCDIW